MIYNFSEIIPRENTASVKFDLRNDFFGTKNVIPMWVADMDFPVPPFVIEALQERLKHPILGYTFRDQAYNESIAIWQSDRHNWRPEHQWISYCPGIVAGLNHAVQAFTNPGDKVLIQTPVYHPFFYSARQNKRELITSELAFDGNHYSIDFEDFERQVKKGVKLFILCNPHNPVGRVWSKADLSRMASICIENKVKIVSDEIHADLVFSPHKHIPLASLSPEIANITITFGSASKTFNLAGLATAYAIISNSSLFKRYNLQLERNGTSHGNLLGYEATKAAYSEQGKVWLNELLTYLWGNKNSVKDFLQKNIPKIKLIEPEGTYLLWLDFNDFKLHHHEVKRLLIHEAGVGLNAGDIFGPSGEGFQRMNIACPESIVEEALGRIAKVFASR